MNRPKRIGHWRMKGIVCTGLCVLALLPIVVVQSATCIKDQNSLSLQSAPVNLKLKFGENEQSVLVDRKELYQNSETTVEHWVAEEETKLKAKVDEEHADPHWNDAEADVNYQALPIDHAKEKAREYVDMNLKNEEVPSYDNVDDYYDQQKANVSDLRAKSLVKNAFEDQSQIKNNYFDGEKIIFNGDKFTDFKEMMRWNIPISELISKVDSAFVASLVVTTCAATITAVSAVLGFFTPFSFWGVTTTFGSIAFEYLLCTLLLFIIKQFLISLSKSGPHQIFATILSDPENKDAWTTARWLYAGMRVCEIIISLSKSFVWIPAVSSATDCLYNFGMSLSSY